MSDHDKAIIEAAERLVDWWGGPMGGNANFGDILIKAVAAKREAAKPKLLSADEAYRIWTAKPDPIPAQWKPDMDRVLTAERERTLKVIEATAEQHGLTIGGLVMDALRTALGASKC